MTRKDERAPTAPRSRDDSASPWNKRERGRMDVNHAQTRNIDLVSKKTPVIYQHQHS